MKILIVTYDTWDTALNGATLVCRYLAEALARRKHTVRIVAGAAAPEKSDDCESTIEQYELIYNYFARRRYQRPECIYDDPQQLSNFERGLKAFKPDIVHFNHLEFLSPRMILKAREQGCPTVYTAHDYYLICQQANLLTNGYQLCEGPGCGIKCGKCYPCSKHDRDLYPSLGHLSLLLRFAASRGLGMRSWIYEKRMDLMRNCFRSLAALVSPSHYLLQKLNALGLKTNNDTVIANGLPGPGKVEQDDQIGNVPNFVYLGGTRKHKGIQLLLDAFQKMRYKSNLFIYGYSDPLAVMLLKKRLHNCRSKIHFMGSFSSRNIDKILANMDFHILPSIWEETYSLVVVEALMGGIPSIVPDRGAAKDNGDLGKNIFTFEFRNSQALAAVIEHVIENKHRIPKRPIQKQEWNTDAMAEKYEQLYIALLNDRTRKTRASEGGS